MPRTRSLAWSELKLGLLTIAAVIIATVTIFMLTGSRGFFWQQYALKTRFPNVAGLKPGSPVRVAGIPVGTVDDWKFVGNEVEVTFNVNKDMRERITSRSTATLGSISVLGEATVDVTPGSGGTPIPDGGFVQAGRIPAQIADVTDQASQGIQQLTALLQDVQRGQGTVGKFLKDDTVYTELQRSVTALGDLTEGIKQGKGAAGKLLTDKATADELDRSLKNLESLTTQLSSGKGSLGVLMNDDSFARSLSATTDSLQTLVAKINRGEGTAGKLLNDTALYDRLDSMTTRLDQLIGQLNQGEGTVGQLLKDRQLYENMNKVTTELASLITQIEKDPGKYLRLKVSIF
jgi:phospholipid/cholesterol/gamma-HCH transport system substrate-binding protein